MFLGIDIGTSGVKAVAVDETGTVVDQSVVELRVSRPAPLQSEQEPSDWWAATNKAVADISKDHRKAVKAIGLSGQMHGAALIDKAGAAIRPAILWNDGRSLEECAELEESLPALGEITGNRAMPGFTAPKLLWLRKHEPETFEKTEKVLLPKDYVRLRMTGDYASDMSDSAGTLWLDTKARDWSDAVLNACSLSRDHMPALYEGNEVTGRLRGELAEAWGMERVPVAAGGGDNAAGAVGSGTVRTGDAFLSLGTSGVTFLADSEYRPNPAGGVHTFCHALPNRWHEMSVMLSAASAVDWVAKTAGFSDPAALFAAVEERNTPCSTEMFLPYLSGERTPHNNPLAQGVFFGLTQSSDAVSLGQATLEGVAFGLADGIDALHATGAQIETLSVIGGGARSHYWGRILSSVFNQPLIYRKGGEVGPAYGAARLARLALTGEDIEDVCTPPPIETVIEPSEKLTEQLAARRPLFQALYTSLEPHFKENA
ncbi:xylulokinase [Hyphococcus luteus]|uniref:Xylulose kinase n=1 Tax=Hyphococcus luteus TaxID=2058213 RepID=A0A2S7KAL8_9PROT|nr:xylulokinase [Marinicaulis flavus]PQA89518.1 xylulokinase [Marinicaulis flavus]